MTNTNIKKIMMVFACTAALTGSISPASAASNDWGGFWSCWWDRDLKGDGKTFTGGCWDRHMGLKISDSAKSQLDRRNLKFQKDLDRLKQDFQRDTQQIVRSNSKP